MLSLMTLNVYQNDKQKQISDRVHKKNSHGFHQGNSQTFKKWLWLGVRVLNNIGFSLKIPTRYSRKLYFSDPFSKNTTTTIVNGNLKFINVKLMYYFM